MSHVSDPAAFAETVTPSNTDNLTSPARSLYVGGTGNVSVEMYGSGTMIFSSVPAGTILPVQITRVNLTNTTATNMVALH